MSGDRTTSLSGDAAGNDRTTSLSGDAAGNDRTTSFGGDAAGNDRTTSLSGDAAGNDRTTSLSGDAAGPDSHVYFAHKHTRGGGCAVFINATLNRSWLDLFFSTDPVARIRLRERIDADPPSSYWGWVATDRPDRYTFVWPSEVQTEVCFAYGSKAEQDRGRGRKVCLIVEEVA